jgi:hypothetical protein
MISALFVLMPGVKHHDVRFVTPILILTISMSSNIALQSFSLNNNITEISPQDAIFRFDADANKKINREAPWSKE